MEMTDVMQTLLNNLKQTENRRPLHEKFVEIKEAKELEYLRDILALKEKDSFRILNMIIWNGNLLLLVEIDYAQEVPTPAPLPEDYFK